MSLMTWTIEIRADFNEKSKEAIMLSDIRSHCKAMYATAQLLADGRKPDIALSTSDMFEGSETISMFVDGEIDDL